MNTPSVPDNSNLPLPQRVLSENSRVAEEEETSGWTLADAPWVTLLLLAVNIVVFFCEWKAGGGNIPLISQQFGVKDNLLIDAGQKWRFVTPIFLHGSLSHLLMNSISLVWLGSQIENIFGRRKYFLIYIVAGIAGNVASYYKTPGPSLGASGAIFGLVGAGLIFPIRWRSLLPEETRKRILSQLLMVAALNLGAGFAIQGVDNYAHMGGLVGGAFAALFLLPDVLDERPRTPLLNNLLLWLGVAGMCGVVGWAGLSQWKLYRPTVMVPMLMRYSPAARNPWWTVSVPQPWSLKNGQWVKPDGARLSFTDTTLEPALKAQLDKLVGQQNVTVLDMGINGRPVRRFILPSPSRITEIWEVGAYGQKLVFTLQCTPANYAQASRDLLAVLALLEIHHAPNLPAAPGKK